MGRPPDRHAVRIRPLVEADRDAVVGLGRELVAAADTYAFDPAIDDAGLWAYWTGPGTVAHVAETGDGDGPTRVVGVYVLRPNHPGPGSHVANASYAVAAAARGRGIGRLLGVHSLDEAARRGYRAIQFNAVVETNTAAVQLWTSLGFTTIGRVPGGFRLPDGRYVDLLVMFRSLTGSGG